MTELVNKKHINKILELLEHNKLKSQKQENPWVVQYDTCHYQSLKDL
jgi:hypothetical protein